MKLWKSDEIKLILKIREINQKKHIMAVERDLLDILDAYESFALDYHNIRGVRFSGKWKIEELKNAFKLALGRNYKTGMGGRRSRVKQIQKEIRMWGYSIFKHAEYVQKDLESRYAKSTIYEALRTL